MDVPTPRRQSKAEAPVSDEMMAFQHEFVGRGPERIRTRMVDDLMIVRSSGVFASAEKQLADSYEGRRLIEAMINPPTHKGGGPPQGTGPSLTSQLTLLRGGTNVFASGD
jgi:hypothetical protein